MNKVTDDWLAPEEYEKLKASMAANARANPVVIPDGLTFIVENDKVINVTGNKVRLQAEEDKSTE